MKFELIGLCPFSKCPINRKSILAIFPIIINVKPETRTGNALIGCEEPKYRVNIKTANQIRADVGLSEAPRDCTVCEHMGRIIE